MLLHLQQTPPVFKMRGVWPPVFRAGLEYQKIQVSALNLPLSEKLLYNKLLAGNTLLSASTLYSLHDLVRQACLFTSFKTVKITPIWQRISNISFKVAGKNIHLNSSNCLLLLFQASPIVFKDSSIPFVWPADCQLLLIEKLPVSYFHKYCLELTLSLRLSVSSNPHPV